MVTACPWCDHSETPVRQTPQASPGRCFGEAHWEIVSTLASSRYVIGRRREAAIGDNRTQRTNKVTYVERSIET
jgi:hypothetical protein